MLIQDLNHIETVAENVEGGASVSGYGTAFGNFASLSIGGSASDSETDFGLGYGGVSFSEDVEQAGGKLKLTSFGLFGAGLKGGLTIKANA